MTKLYTHCKAQCIHEWNTQPETRLLFRLAMGMSALFALAYIVLV